MELKIAFISLSILTTVFLAKIGFKAINDTGNNVKLKIKLGIGLLLWQCYIYAVSTSGIITNYDFPPLFALAFIIPSFLFTGIFLYRNKNKRWITSIPESWIIYFQSFRIAVETLFVLAFAKGIFNKEVTIEGYNYDMIIGLSAPIIAYLVYQKKSLSKQVIVIWNYLGLAVLFSVIFLFITSLYTPEIYGSSHAILPLESLTYPYVLIAGFLMPTAVFLHCLSLVQLNRLKSLT